MSEIAQVVGQASDGVGEDDMQRGMDVFAWALSHARDCRKLFERVSSTSKLMCAPPLLRS